MEFHLKLSAFHQKRRPRHENMAGPYFNSVLILTQTQAFTFLPFTLAITSSAILFGAGA